MSERLPLPRFVDWPIFPFEGEMRVKELLPDMAEDFPREGEGGRPCSPCGFGDEHYLWVDERWRIAAGRRKGLPVVMLETRDHLDLGDLEDDMAAEMGVLTVRIDRAMRASGEVGRTQFNRSGDGGSHFHLWCYGRPTGSLQLLGMGVPLWAEILPPLPLEEWHRRILAVGEALAAGGGTLVGCTRSPFEDATPLTFPKT